MSMQDRYPCPCCGYKTLALAPPGTDLSCPICGWEDQGERHSSGSKQVSLQQAQRNFIAFGACERLWLNDVRPPTEADMHDPNWQTIDQSMEKTRLELIEKIAVAFEDVTLEDGISLHQARAFDDYEDGEAAQQIDGNMRWQELPDAWLEEFFDVFSFMDAKGLRHAIPAYMTWCLQLSPAAYGLQSFESTCEILTSVVNQCRYGERALLKLLDQPQRQIMAEVLEFLEQLEFLDRQLIKH